MDIEVSIVVPVYNVEQYIEKCIKSLKAQSLKTMEVIIVNDGTEDSSIQICEKVIDGDNRFRIIHKENGGLMSAWKMGVNNAFGKYIGFVDSDDWVDPEMFSVLLEEIKKTNADIVCSGYVAEGRTGQRKVGRENRFEFRGIEIRENFIRDYCFSYFNEASRPTICRWDKIYKKQLLLDNMIYFNEKVSLGEDFNTNIALLLDAQKIVLLPGFYPYHYRDNPKSIVNTINPRAFENIAELSHTCNWIVEKKRYDAFYTDSFIGHMIFEEVNRICRTVEMNRDTKKELLLKLEMCNANKYIVAYTKARKRVRIYLYSIAFRCKWIRLVQIMCKVYH